MEDFDHMRMSFSKPDHDRPGQLTMLSRGNSIESNADLNREMCKLVLWSQFNCFRYTTFWYSRLPEFSQVSSSSPPAFISPFDTSDPAHASYLNSQSPSVSRSLYHPSPRACSGASVPPYFGAARQEVPTPPDGMGLAHYRPIYGARVEKECTTVI